MENLELNKIVNETVAECQPYFPSASFYHISRLAAHIALRKREDRIQELEQALLDIKHGKDFPVHIVDTVLGLDK